MENKNLQFECIGMKENKECGIRNKSIWAKYDK